MEKKNYSIRTIKKIKTKSESDELKLNDIKRLSDHLFKASEKIGDMHSTVYVIDENKRIISSCSSLEEDFDEFLLKPQDNEELFVKKNLRKDIPYSEVYNSKGEKVSVINSSINYYKPYQEKYNKDIKAYDYYDYKFNKVNKESYKKVKEFEDGYNLVMSLDNKIHIIDENFNNILDLDIKGDENTFVSLDFYVKELDGETYFIIKEGKFKSTISVYKNNKLIQKGKAKFITVYDKVLLFENDSRKIIKDFNGKKIYSTFIKDEEIVIHDNVSIVENDDIFLWKIISNKTGKLLKKVGGIFDPGVFLDIYYDANYTKLKCSKIDGKAMYKYNIEKDELEELMLDEDICMQYIIDENANNGNVLYRSPIMRFGVMNNGKSIIDDIYSSIEEIMNGKYYIVKDSNRRCGLFDEEGNEIIEFGHYKIYALNDNIYVDDCLIDINNIEYEYRVEYKEKDKVLEKTFDSKEEADKFKKILEDKASLRDNKVEQIRRDYLAKQQELDSKYSSDYKELDDKYKNKRSQIEFGHMEEKRVLETKEKEEIDSIQKKYYLDSDLILEKTSKELIKRNEDK